VLISLNISNFKIWRLGNWRAEESSARLIWNAFVKVRERGDFWVLFILPIG
jgi:hypothetical protein